jgi:hypothetical protein
MANYSFRTYLYDAKNNLVSSGANTKLGQNCAGERDASAVLKSVTDLIEASAAGDAYAIAPAAVQPAQARPRPSSRNARPRIAVFPYLVSGGGDYRAKQVAQECLAQLKGRESIEIAYSFYPDATAGASLAADKAVAKSSWSGLVSASPNTDLLKIRAQELGLDFIVQLQLAVDQYGPAAMANYSFRTYLYDSKNNLVSSGASTKLGQNCAGERNASAVRASVTDLIDAAY